MKLALRLAIVLAVVALAVIALRMTRPDPVAVAVAAAESGRVETTVANTRAGSVSACRRSKLAPPLGGRIEKLTVREGDRVKQGQVLLELWHQDLAARERVAREQQLTARAHVVEACQVADNAERDAARARQLKDKNFISEERVDRAESEAKARRAGCEAARALVQEAEARIMAAPADTARTVVREHRRTRPRRDRVRPLDRRRAAHLPLALVDLHRPGAGPHPLPCVDVHHPR